MRRTLVIATLLAAVSLVAVAARRLVSQETAAPGAGPELVTFTTQQDHQNMMDQLGIASLRPGPSGNDSAPNAANNDESLANPYPVLPDPLTLKNGEKVLTAEAWLQQRRPEIVEDFEREVYGRVPANVPAVTWTVTATSEKKIGPFEVIEKELAGKVDNSACPQIEVEISMTVTTPKNAPGPVPALMMYGFRFGPGGFGGKGPPKGKGNDGKGKDGKGFGKGDGKGFGKGGKGFGPPGPNPHEKLLEAGWGFVTIFPASVQADNGAGLTRGIIGLVNKGQPRKPDDWGALRAWAWGAARGLDYLETDPAIDAKRVGIEGVSRYGKAALVAMAFEPRFAVALVSSSGEGGAKLHRRNFGEALENVTGSGEYHWMAGNFLKYGAAEGKFGSMNASDLPVDSHELIALCAPRPTFISYGSPKGGDPHWVDQRGSFMAAVAAQPVFRLLGAKDMGVGDDFLTVVTPAADEGLLSGDLAWRQHSGGHTDAPNMEHFVKWAGERWAGR